MTATAGMSGSGHAIQTGMIAASAHSASAGQIAASISKEAVDSAPAHASSSDPKGPGNPWRSALALAGVSEGQSSTISVPNARELNSERLGVEERELPQTSAGRHGARPNILAFPSADRATTTHATAEKSQKDRKAAIEHRTKKQGKPEPSTAIASHPVASFCSAIPAPTANPASGGTTPAAAHTSATPPGFAAKNHAEAPGLLVQRAGDGCPGAAPQVAPPGQSEPDHLPELQGKGPEIASAPTIFPPGVQAVQGAANGMPVQENPPVRPFASGHEGTLAPARQTEISQAGDASAPAPHAANLAALPAMRPLQGDARADSQGSVPSAPPLKDVQAPAPPMDATQPGQPALDRPAAPSTPAPVLAPDAVPVTPEHGKRSRGRTGPPEQNHVPQPAPAVAGASLAPASGALNPPNVVAPAAQAQAEPGTGASGPGATQQTFAALDAAGDHVAPTWVHASAHQAEAGFQDPNLGWVSVRAHGSAGAIHAALVPGSAEAAQALSSHLAGLQAYLNDRQTPLHSLHVAQPEGVRMGQGGQGFGQGAGQGQDPSAGQDSHSRDGLSHAGRDTMHVPGTAGITGQPAAGQSALLQTVQVARPAGGTYVSVMA